MREPHRLIGVPLEQLTTPRDGDTYTDRWWIVLAAAAVFYQRAGSRGWTPQCNKDRRLIDRFIRDAMYPDATAVHLPAAYLGQWDEECGHLLRWADTDNWIIKDTTNA